MQMWQSGEGVGAGGAPCSAAEPVLAADFYALSPAKRLGRGRA
jgi:hypothetical protein